MKIPAKQLKGIYRIAKAYLVFADCRTCVNEVRGRGGKGFYLQHDGKVIKI